MKRAEMLRRSILLVVCSVAVSPVGAIVIQGCWKFGASLLVCPAAAVRHCDPPPGQTEGYTCNDLSSGPSWITTVTNGFKCGESGRVNTMAGASIECVTTQRSCTQVEGWYQGPDGCWVGPTSIASYTGTMPGTGAACNAPPCP